MRLPDPMRRAIMALLPWYHSAEVEARHARTRQVLRDSRAAMSRADEATAELWRHAEDGALHR